MRACECVSAIMGRRVNPLRGGRAPLKPSAAGLICHLQRRNKGAASSGFFLMGKLYPFTVTRALSLLLPRKDLNPRIFCHGSLCNLPALSSFS